MSSQRPTFGRDLVEQDVAAEQPAAVTAEQRDVAVRVTWQHEHLERLAGQIERVALVHEVRRLDGRIGTRPPRPAERSAILGGMP